MLAFKERLIIWGFITYAQGHGFEKQSEEPSCNSRFDCEYKLLSKVVALETTAAKLEDLISLLKQQIVDTNKKLATQNELLEYMSGGSTYTRWGRKTCNANGTHTVYSGYAAGSSYKDPGTAVNYLCLTKEPLWSRFGESVKDLGSVYGAEYEFEPQGTVKYFDREIKEYSAPCAVCESSRSRVLMIPGRNKCLDGWTLEYEGYLMAGGRGHAEFICLDANPDSLPHDTGNNKNKRRNEFGQPLSPDMKLIYFARTSCIGSLKCPPYVHNRELTCVVCTK